MPMRNFFSCVICCYFNSGEWEKQGVFFSTLIVGYKIILRRPPTISAVKIIMAADLSMSFMPSSLTSITKVAMQGK